MACASPRYDSPSGSPRRVVKPPLHQISATELRSRHTTALDDSNTIACCRLEHQGTPPTARTGHTALVHKDMMVVFGGESDQAIHNDLFVLNMNPEARPCAWTRVDAGGTVPTERHGHSAVLWEDSMLVFGGGGLLQVWDDCYEYRVGSQTWYPVMATGDTPPGRKYHTAAVYEGNMFIYGGDQLAPGINTNPNVITDVHVLNIESREWRCISTDTDAQFGGWVPKPLTRHSTAADKENIYMFGGFLNIVRGKELQHIHVTTKGNVRVNRMTYTGPPPSTRSGHSATIFKENMYVFGGEGDNARMNDFYELNLESFSWRPLTLTGDVPPETAGHTMVLFQNKLIIFGGAGGETPVKTSRTNDLWEIDIGGAMDRIGRRGH